MMQNSHTIRRSMQHLRRALRMLVATAALLLALVAFPAAQQQQQPPGSPDEFVPIDKLPTAEELPAAPLVIGAYAVAWIAAFGYLWSIWQRTNRVERELAELGQRINARESRR